MRSTSANILRPNLFTNRLKCDLFVRDEMQKAHGYNLRRQAWHRRGLRRLSSTVDVDFSAWTSLPAGLRKASRMSVTY